MARTTRWIQNSLACCLALVVHGAAVGQTLMPAPLDELGAQDREVEVVRERYPNRAIKVEREVTQDAEGNYRNHGAWKMYNIQGTLIAEGKYVEGERDGLWTRWFQPSESKIFAGSPYIMFTPPFVSQATFDRGRLDGTWAIYDAKQRKISEIAFVDGQRNGPAIWYFSNGRVMRQLTYRDGVLQGEAKEWKQDGQLAVNDLYEDGRLLGKKTEYHKASRNPPKKSEGTYLIARLAEETPDDWWNAKFATYTKQGRDERHGTWMGWFMSGQVQVTGQYKSDTPVGIFIWWFENGQKATQGEYKEGKAHGKWTYWHQNGQKSVEGLYTDGNPSGPWSWWAEDGKISQAADFSNHDNTETVKLPTAPMVEEAGVPQLQR